MTAMIGLNETPFKTLAGTPDIIPEEATTDHITFGAVHLNNTNLDAATAFWTQVVGMTIREKTNTYAAFGTETHTLVVVHQAAQTPFQEGFSGLYHYAIHAPDKVAFARMIRRLIDHNHPFSPVDHTMSKSIYLRDTDGILLEFALETPERFRRVITEGGLYMEDTDGSIRGASAALNVGEELKVLAGNNTPAPLHTDTKIGHIHFYATDLDQTNAFYRQLGFIQFNYLSKYHYADVGAGGVYKHRVAMNTWHGNHKPLAPQGNAGLRHYTILFESDKKLKDALQHIARYEKKEDGYWLSDPSGNTICLQINEV